MARFRREPTFIDAEQWFPGRAVAGVFVDDPARADPGNAWPVDQAPPTAPRHFVVTAHRQRVYLEPGDWVIAEPDGVHHYPCKPDIFRAIYKPA
jgi:hypothetical protein